MGDKQYQWVVFNEHNPIDPKLKTKIWSCFAKTGPFLGSVRWWSHWRRYCFFPQPETLFDANCLWDIADWCASQTTEQKQKKVK
jgi:hypothetical protein